MAFTKKGKKYLEFRRALLPEQEAFHTMLGIKPCKDIRPEDSGHLDPKEASKRIDEALKWL